MSVVAEDRNTGADTRRGTVIGALAGGFTTAMVQMPLDAIYGTMAFAALGPSYAPLAVASALIGSVVAHAAATLAGSRHLVLGPRASTTLLVAGLIATLLAQPELRAAGPAAVPQALALAALGLAMAGLLQVIFGQLGLGSLTRYLPYPVRAGFLNGVGALLVLSGLRLLFGLPPTPDPSQVGGMLGILQEMRGGAVVVGVVTIAATLLSARWRGFAPLFGLVAGIALHHLLAAFAPALRLSPTLAGVGSPVAGLGVTAEWLHIAGDASLRSLLPLLLGFAFAVALLASLDTFLAGSVMDSVRRTRRNGNRELVAQGISNIASAVIGGQPSAPGISRSMLVLQAGGRSHWGIVVYATLVAATVLFAPNLLHFIPMSAVGGALVVIGWQMVDEWSRRVPRQLLQGSRGDAAALGARQRRTLIENYVVMLLVAGTLIVVGLAEGIVVGVIAAMVLFVRSNSHALVRQVMLGDVRRSVKVRAPASTAALDKSGSRIALIELEGNVFFGTSDELADRVRALSVDADFLILAMRRVTDIDGTGARTLLELANDLGDMAKWLIVADLGPNDARMQTIQAMRSATASHVAGHGLRLEPDIDVALQWAEDQLLERLGHLQTGHGPLTLEQTVLGSGLTPADVQWLRAQMTERQYRRGQHLFHAGDPGDALYISTQGEISILLPGTGRKRLASFAPGVVVGELALLQNIRRTADAVAESDISVLRLERDSFDRIRALRPELWDSLMRNLTMHLSSRLRSVTMELSAALEP
jgi:sulfate permease, SulP family